ncbi:MAG: DUF86 domain-containing protein [Thermodesulfobacteriota bacterium]|jgi:uncharacterized protein YutE (UPF0331/DUF86 family)
MLDERRILAKIDELDGYLSELRAVAPGNLEQYGVIEKKRSCERLLQLCVECVIDICRILVSGMRLGLPSDENDLFLKLQKNRIVTSSMAGILRQMRSFRNILVHEYAAVDDELVFTFVKNRLEDFDKFKKLVLKALKKRNINR